MKLFEVFNGYTGYEEVHVEVIAENENRAYELASERFKEYAKSPTFEKMNEIENEACRKYPNRNRSEIKDYLYPSKFWEELEIVYMYDLAGDYEEYVSEVYW